MASPLLQVVNEEIQSFIRTNEDVDERALVLKNKHIHGVSAAIVAGQIASRRKAQGKLPSYYRTPGIVYPPAVNLEQCSSEVTARFKARIITGTAFGGIPPVLVGADLTGGFGVDSLFLSRVCRQFHAVEPNEELVELAKHNHRLLGTSNIQYHSQQAESFLSSSTIVFDFIFIDPSRRNGTAKIVRLADCQPSVPGLLPVLFQNAQRVLLKASPLLDLQQGAGELNHVKNVYVVSVDNECKEVLFDCQRDTAGEPTVHCVHLSSKPTEGNEMDEFFSFTFSEEREAMSAFSDPKAYLYEPSAAILKAGAFKLVGNRHGLFKLQVNTHLYTSDQIEKGFTGRIFKIESINPDAKLLRSLLPNRKANVLVRNYPLSVDGLKKKLKIADGGETYLIGCSGINGKFLLVGTRVQ